MYDLKFLSNFSNIYQLKAQLIMSFVIDPCISHAELSCPTAEPLLLRNRSSDELESQGDFCYESSHEWCYSKIIRGSL